MKNVILLFLAVILIVIIGSAVFGTAFGTAGGQIELFSDDIQTSGDYSPAVKGNGNSFTWGGEGVGDSAGAGGLMGLRCLVGGAMFGLLAILMGGAFFNNAGGSRRQYTKEDYYRDNPPQDDAWWD